eukprot:jgi/Mesen1/5015/ME000025S04414
MASFRLTSLWHSDAAKSLPLPTLSQNDVVVRDWLRASVGSTVTSNIHTPEALLDLPLNHPLFTSQASKISEFLQQADVSYLKMRDQGSCRHEAANASSSSLRVLLREINPAFFLTPADCSQSQIPAGLPVVSSSQLCQSGGISVQLSAPVLEHEAVQQLLLAPEACHTATPSGNDEPRLKPVAKRRRTTQTKTRQTVSNPFASEDEQKGGGGDATDAFCELLDEICSKSTFAAEEDEEVAVKLLSSKDLRSLSEAVLKLRVSNQLRMVPHDNLAKLMVLLEAHIQEGFGKQLDDHDDLDSSTFTSIVSTFEAAQIATAIMTANDMPKHVFSEEIIDKIIEVTRFHIVHNIFVFFDPSYRQIHKESNHEEEEDGEEEDILEGAQSGNILGKRGRKKNKLVRSKKRVNSTKASKAVGEVLQKLCSVLASLIDLVSLIKLQDSSILQLSKTIVETFGVENIHILQLKALSLLCAIHDKYQQHRTIIMEDVISLLWKLPAGKRNLRTYHLPEVNKSIQMITALVLRLVQCSVEIPEMKTGATASGAEVEDVHAASKFVEPAIEVATFFWKNVMELWGAPRAHEGIETKTIVENLTIDLLAATNSPEYPSAGLLLQVLVVFLLGASASLVSGLKSKDAVTRGMAIDLLGLIAVHLKADSLASNGDKCWLIKDVSIKTEDGGELHALSQERARQECSVCGTSCTSSSTLSCKRCERLFHNECVGVSDHEIATRGWLCQLCHCKGQLAALMQSAEGERPPVDNRSSEAEGRKSEDVAERLNIIESKVEAAHIAQQLLLNYLAAAVTEDPAASDARRFYLCQWLREESQVNEGEPPDIAFHWRRYQPGGNAADIGTTQCCLQRDSILRVARALRQQSSLARAFDRILKALLECLDEQSPMPRAKALKAISAVVETDPMMLRDLRVQRVVEKRFLDSAISVREAATDLVGKYIVHSPDVAAAYYEKVAERIMDTGVSVRKKAIRIIKDVCQSQREFAKTVDGCVKILSRVNDDETSIRDLVTKTFYELWFEDQLEAEYRETSDIAPNLAAHTNELVEVLKKLPNNQPLVAIIKRSLSHGAQSNKTAAGHIAVQNAVRRRCELMCKHLLDSIVQVDESMDATELHALPFVSALHAFCTVDPTLCAPYSDPSRFVVTLLPYLKLQGQTRDVSQLIEYIVYIMDAVLPLLRRPSPILLEELERDLYNLIRRHQYLTVVHAAIKCLHALAIICPKVENTYRQLLAAFIKTLGIQQGPTPQKAVVERSLFAIGLFVRYGADTLAGPDGVGLQLDIIISKYKEFLRSPDFGIKMRALQGLGFVFIARPDQMLDEDIKTLLRATLSARADKKLKVQTLKNFLDYLHAVEKKMSGGSSDGDVMVDGATVPVAAGAGDSNNWTGIAQLYWDPILGRCFDNDSEVRCNALKVIEVVLRQGLVHPMSSVPHLIALEVDQCEANSKMAHRLLIHMYTKYADLFESRLGDGLQHSFDFLKSGAATGKPGNQDHRAAQKLEQNNKQENTTTAATASESSRLGIGRVYKLIRGSRSSRNKFLASVVRKFDFGMEKGSTPQQQFLQYCAEVLAALPFGVPDEPLYLVFNINRVVTLRGGSLQANIKTAISGDGPLAESARATQEEIAREHAARGEEAYDIFATDDAVPSQLEPASAIDTPLASEEAFEKVKRDSNAAMAISLLLILKRYIKDAYNLSDARCQSFQTTEALKPGDILSKRDVGSFSANDLPLGPPDSMRQILVQYAAFKKLVKEDSTQDFAGVSTPAKRRGNAASLANVPEESASDNVHENSMPPPPPRSRRKSAPGPATYAEDVEEEADDDFEASEDDISRGKAKKWPAGGKAKGRRKSFK